jgi:hypothetical protein
LRCGGDLLSEQWSSETYLNNALSGGFAGLICGPVLGPAAAGIGGSVVRGTLNEAGAAMTAGTMAKGMLLFGTWSGLDNSIRQIIEGRSDTFETVEAFLEGSVFGGAFALAGKVASGIRRGAAARLEAEGEPTAGRLKNASDVVEGAGSKTFNSVDDIINNPQSLYGKSKADVQNILNEGWTEGIYGSAGTGWEFTKRDQSIFYHPEGGVHRGSYYGYSRATTGRVKIVSLEYVALPGDKATIIQGE